MAAASSDSTKAASAATSSGRTNRPIGGVRGATAPRARSYSIGVSVAAGAMTLTVMPRKYRREGTHGTGACETQAEHAQVAQECCHADLTARVGGNQVPAIRRQAADRRHYGGQHQNRRGHERIAPMQRRMNPPAEKASTQSPCNGSSDVGTHPDVQLAWR